MRNTHQTIAQRIDAALATYDPPPAGPAWGIECLAIALREGISLGDLALYFKQPARVILAMENGLPRYAWERHARWVQAIEARGAVYDNPFPRNKH